MNTPPVVFIPLTQGQVAVIDFADFDKVRGPGWRAIKQKRRVYAARRSRMPDGKRPWVWMHQAITGCPPELEVNHVNGDGLDNRRENLQVCTHQQNTFAYRRKKKGTSSIYRGVSWSTRYEWWQAKITQNGKYFYLGVFGNEELAARAYDAKARELFGEHAAPNFPIENL